MCGLAGGGVYHASDVTIAAVRSYRTISPLPSAPTQKLIQKLLERDSRPYIFCGTFPRITPGGH